MTNQKARVHKNLEPVAAERRAGNSGADGGRCSGARRTDGRSELDI